jgi:two-component sensor histidine kinase
MYKSVITILFALASLQALAQNWHEADSLRKALKKGGGPDTARVNTLLRLAEFEIFKPGELKKDLDSAVVYLDQAKKLGRNVQSTEITGHIVLTESCLVKEQGHQQQGRVLIENAIKILSKGADKYHLGQAYLSLAGYYDNNNPVGLHQELNVLTLAANALKNTGYTEREAFAYEMIGDLDTTAPLALKHLTHSLELYQSIHYKKLQAVYDALGSVYLIETNYKPALDYQLKALKAAQETHDTTMLLCEINNHIGITYFKLREYEQAIKYYKAALRIAEVYKDIPTIYLMATNICNAELGLRHPQEVLNTLHHTLTRYPTPPADAENDARFTEDYIQAYTLLKQYELAAPYSNHLVNLLSHHNFEKRDLSDIYAALIKYYFASRRYSQELIYLKKNDTLTRQLGSSTNISINNAAWFMLDTAQHNYKAAVRHLLIRNKIQDSTFTAIKNKQIKQLQVQFDTKAKEDQIKLLNQKTELDKSNLKRANLIKNVTVGGIILSLIIAGLLLRQSRLRKKNSQIVNRKNELITQKNELLQSMVTEKEWLLKEVHHRVKNNLHSVICLLEAQAAYLENDALQAIENSQHRIYTMSLIHQKLYQSDDVKTIDMTHYIPELVQYLRDSFGNSDSIHFQLTVDPIQLNASQAIPLALIINEALTNSMKYAFPDARRGEVTISLTNHGAQYKLEIADNGIGLSENSVKTKKGSLGLELIRGLAKEISGELTMENTSGVRIIILFGRDLLHTMDQLQDDYLESA